MNKKLTIVLLIGLSALATGAGAKDKKTKNNTPEPAPAPEVQQEEEPAITEECLINISLFNESAKNKQYADAVEPWMAVFNECPNANRVIYTRGRDIIHWQLSQAKTPEEYNQLRDLLMKLYDKRIKYFGEDPKYPTPYILGLKALDYITYFPEDSLKTTAYGWLKESVEGQKENSQIEVLRLYVVLSDGIYKADNSKAENYINDYLLAGSYLDAVKNSGSKNAEAAGQVKQWLDVLFAQSGAASQEILDNTYRDMVNSKLDDLDFLNHVTYLYRRTGNTESEVYFTAAAASHKIQPSAESASGCAGMSYVRGDYAQAVKYYEEAVRLSDDVLDKADNELKIASILYKQSSYSNARAHARKSIEYNPQQCAPYILIATMYAGSKPFDDHVLNKTVYWVAVDELQKAKRNNPDCAESVNEYIARYSRYFPTTEEVFFQPELQKGNTFYVGGWIGESTTCR